jgi:hypothetical protein
VCLFLVDLGCKVVSDVAHGADGVLHHDRNIRREGQGDGGAQGGGLGEQSQVPQGKVQVHGLLHVDDHSVFVLVDGSIVLEHDVAGAQVTSGGEADSLLGDSNRAL